MRIAFALSGGAEAILAAEATRHGHDVVAIVATATDVAATVSSAQVDVVIVSGSSTMLTEPVLAQCDGHGIRLLAVIASDAERRHASSLGLYELMDATATWPDYERVLLGNAGAQPPTRVEKAGQVIAVWGPAGAPGRTSMAIGIAIELALAGYSVALGDVDTHGASIAPALGMLDEAPGFAAACRLAGAGGLTATELERIGQQYLVRSSSLWVLTGIGRPSRWPELSGDRVNATIAECRKWVDFTVLDTGFSLENDEEISSDLFSPKRNGATIAALRDADRVIAVGAADPVGLSRFLRTYVDLLELCEPDRVSVVMNKVRASAIGMNPSGQVTQTLTRFGGIDAAALVPWDQAGFDAAVLSGTTLAEVSPKSPARLAVQQLVRERLLGKTGPARAQRLFRSRPHTASA